MFNGFLTISLYVERQFSRKLATFYKLNLFQKLDTTFDTSCSSIRYAEPNPEQKAARKEGMRQVNGKLTYRHVLLRCEFYMNLFFEESAFRGRARFFLAMNRPSYVENILRRTLLRTAFDRDAWQRSGEES